MSGDDIVFGDVNVREPVRMRRPDRDTRRAAIAFGTPRADDLPIFLAHGPADEIERHALSDTSVELGGILLGKECVDDETGEPFVLITAALEAKHYENSQASFTYTHDSWGEITRERDQKHPDLDIVGWYHTHPDFGIFLSSHDLFIHHHFFAQPLQVAYVVDPIRQIRGFFQWRDGSMAAVRGYFLCGERNERVAISKLVNELENLPNPEGSGGLSPRLEAELLAMISRPQNATVIDRGSTAVVFGLFGTLLGALAVGIVISLWTLNQQVGMQREDIARLTEVRETVSDRSRDSASAKEAAIERILSEVKIGTPPQEISQRLIEAERENIALKAASKVMENEIESFQIGQDELRRQHRDEINRLKQERDTAEDARLKLEKAAAEPKPSGGNADSNSTLNNNVLAWTAIGGWLAFLIAGAGAAVLWMRRPIEEPVYDPRIVPATSERLSAPSGDAANPHVIE